MSQSDAIRKFLAHVRRSLADDTFVALQLKGASSPNADRRRTEVRLVQLKGQPCLSFTTHEAGKSGEWPATHVRGQRSPDPAAGSNSQPPSPGEGIPRAMHAVTKNFPIDAGIRRISEGITSDFRNAMLRTSTRDWQLHCPAKGNPRLVSHRPCVSAIPSREHDRRKNTRLGTGAADWLCALGVSDSNGCPMPSMADKYRQINRFVEILHHLALDCGWGNESKVDPAKLMMVDMGCGKGYLTFAAWHLFRRLIHCQVSILGVDARLELVEGANRVSHQVHAESLQFARGDIASVPLPDLDVLIALHACNTATDDAIRRGIEHGAKLIVVAPCCHQALRPALGDPEPLAPLLRHGLFKERIAEWLTDGLRTLFLEWAGYETKVIEFVGSEHTPKNLMIAAVRTQRPFVNAKARQRIVELKRFFGIESHALDSLLTPATGEGPDSNELAIC